MSKLVAGNGDFWEHADPRAFYTTRLSSLSPRHFILFRFAIVLWPVHVFILSIVNKTANFKGWLIYFTMWSLMLQTLTLLYKLAVAMAYRNEWRPAPKDQQRRLPSHLKVLWTLHNATLAAPIVVSVVFWIVLAPVFLMDKANRDLIKPWHIYESFQTHAINSLVAIVDFRVSAIPIRHDHAWHPALLTVVYWAFTIVYYATGGTTSDGSTRVIYYFADWGNHPWLSTMAFTMILITAVFIHWMFAYYWQRHCQRALPKHLSIKTDN